ncbi:hypothetical protein BgAZ_104400 [Babesia gibsoni]|uniref:Uncharacterized protein n=1 Tax=Babesia gibsoni TaxID=33632 RepID=A0AAD8PFP8_BABGI|nr:hypothetical protein BgAZ_104400 [Babesia gibsoni]
MNIARVWFPNRRAFSSKTLSEGLEEFKQLVSEQSKCRRTFEGWPPASRIPIANEKLLPLQRGLFVMKRSLKDGLRTEPTLVFTCGTKPMLMLNKVEFEALVERLPWIKDQMKEFYKLI